MSSEDVVRSDSYMDSKAMLESLGDDPSSDALANVAAHRANEYIVECLSTEVPSGKVDRDIWESIPQFTRIDLVVGRHLGKGTFSDVFEVIALVIEEDEEPPTRESLDLDSADLDKLIKKRFHSKEADLDKMGMDLNSTDSTSASNSHGEDKTTGHPNRYIEGMNSQEDRLKSDQGRICFPRSRRHTAEDIARLAVKETMTMGGRTLPSRTLAMKCLRPQTRANIHQFMIGVEDLVNETAMLASLDHPNIIKLHGRAGGCDTNSFRLSDGYFILLDRLRDTLDDRIVSWKKTLSANKKSTSTSSPSTSQMQTACSIADAMSYLHSKNIVFRDLKPANVGFDANGVVKLFDFGFAKKVVDPPKLSPSMCSNDGKLSHLLYERCGTVRYMAPEVGLELGHSLPADVYSFGILLWEICSLKKPYDNTKSTIDFDKNVFKKGARPKLSKEWNTTLKDIIANCWLPSANERPTMIDVKSKICAHAREVADSGNGGGSGSGVNKRRSSLLRKFM
ncbi:hypothetical protein ACHAWU_003735 [Discostella pseudostelligera]|uniref:Protein kinase domain-containing protein n=1 Tax=Discostella pseudostelligera TaxID=259834 RepID=A0ABD3N635_9STRA